MAKFRSYFDYKPCDGEINRKVSLVDRSGYVSSQRRIESLMYAGEQLVKARSNEFDFPNGVIDEKYSDPTLAEDFDLSDVSRLINGIRPKSVPEVEKKVDPKPEKAED